MRNITDSEIKYVQEKLFGLLKAFKNVCESEGIWYSLAFGTALGAVRHNGFIPWDIDADVYILLPEMDKFREAFEKHKPEGIRLINFSTEAKCLRSHDTLVYEAEDNIGGIHLDVFQLVGAPSKEKEQKLFSKYAHYMDKIVRSKYVNIKDCRPKSKKFVIPVKCILFFVPDKILMKNIMNRIYKYPYDTSKFLMALSGYGKGRECMPRELFDSVIQADFCGEMFNIPKDYDVYLKRLYGDDYMTPKKY